MLRTLVVITLTLLLGGCNRTDQPASEQPEVLIIAMLGQSNAVGHARLPDCERGPFPRVLVFRRHNVIEPAVEPLDTNEGGWGLILGRALAAAKPGHLVLLVPAAVNGSCIREWDPSMSGGNFDYAIRRIQLAMRTAASLGSPRLYGVIWDQGESDMIEHDDAQAWPARFTAVVHSLRRHWPEAPVLFVQTAQPQGEPATRLRHWQELQSAQAQVTLAGTQLVPALRLPMEDDGVHRTWLAQQLMGYRFATAMLELHQ
jgi:hypothetical protein